MTQEHRTVQYGTTGASTLLSALNARSRRYPRAGGSLENAGSGQNEDRLFCQGVRVHRPGRMARRHLRALNAQERLARITSKHHHVEQGQHTRAQHTHTLHTTHYTCARRQAGKGRESES
jgi:hypothetical protein